MSFSTLTAREQVEKMTEAFPILAHWLSEDREHYFNVGLLLHVPYFELMSIDETTSISLVEKYLKMLQSAQCNLGNDFPSKMNMVIRELDCVEAFRYLLTRHYLLQTIFDDKRFVPESHEEEALLMRLLFDMCKKGWSCKGRCFVQLISHCLKIPLVNEEEFYYSVVELFMLMVQVYNRDSRQVFIQNFKLLMKHANMEVTMRMFLTTLPSISLWKEF